MTHPMELHLWSTVTLSEWDDLGLVNPQDIAQVATDPGTYRVRPAGSDEAWQFFYVQPNGESSLDTQGIVG